MQVLDGRDGFLDALVVGDDLNAVFFLKRDVVVDADEDAFALEGEVAEGDFGHRFLRFDGINGRKGREVFLTGLTRFTGLGKGRGLDRRNMKNMKAEVRKGGFPFMSFMYLLSKIPLPLIP